MECIAGDMDNLVFAVQRHYSANKIPIPKNLRLVMEDYICSINPPTFCKGEYDAESASQASIMNAQKIKEATAMASTRLKWGPDRFLAPIEEAEDRALTCLPCPDNFKGICTTCNGLKDYVVKAIGDRVTRFDDKLGVCTHCSCLVKAKVHISKEALRVVTPPSSVEQYPAHCWMREIHNES